MLYSNQGIDKIILKKLDLKPRNSNKKIKEWEKTINAYIVSKKKVRVGIVGKYIELHDSYKSIFEALPSLLRDKTLFVVAHRLSTVQKSDRILLLNENRLVAMGTHESLLEENEFYQTLVATQQLSAGAAPQN